MESERDRMMKLWSSWFHYGPHLNPSHRFAQRERRHAGLPYRYFGFSLHSTVSVHLPPPSPRTFLRGISTNGRQKESGILVFMLEHGQ